MRGRPWGYWPEIDGLRALAILPVFLFHLEPRLLGGGFVGVDVFFVISGFLITTILLEDFAAGGFQLSGFYQRRIARIAPAFFFVLAATLVAGRLLYSAQDFASLGSNTIFAAASVINVKLLLQGSYFKLSRDAQPLLHYWSLSVEEQFYLLFPSALWVVLRWTRRPLLWIALAAAASYAACIAISARSPSAAFYLLPTRAWELLLGALLALARSRTTLMANGRAVGAATVAGVALLGVAVVRAGAWPDFPGWRAAVPAGGAALILYAVQAREAGPAAWLGARALTWIGRRSYSLYLWHWPVFSFVDYSLYAAPASLRLALKLGLSLAAAAATYTLFERPLRSWLNAPRRRRLAFGAFAAAVMAAGGIGMAVRSANYLSANPRCLARGGIAIDGGVKSVVLIGDSQGAMYGRRLAALARARGFSLNVLSAAAGDELPGRSGSKWPAVEAYLRARRPKVVVIAEAWSAKYVDAAPLRQALASIGALGARTILIEQPPVAPPQATREAIRAGAVGPFYEPPRDRAARLAADRLVRSLAGPKVQVIDIAPVFVGPSGSVKVIAGDGRLNYHDADHLSDEGAAAAVPLIASAVERTLAAP
ncbi:MAG: acyltransferase family protein [Caulobacteraceae bacterium]